MDSASRSHFKGIPQGKLICQEPGHKTVFSLNFGGSKPYLMHFTDSLLLQFHKAPYESLLSAPIITKYLFAFSAYAIS